jgi:hypothetical protein
MLPELIFAGALSEMSCEKLRIAWELELTRGVLIWYYFIIDSI